ncbi:N-6 DNA methylase [uncultured Helicobacter sp.]|uniref:N-6 DNA methylase n=1 Tax=uncultured Helicobacter sp. TaxID=175537 RepID=UPI0026254C6F|nr:N-6 DNA methylase [uncultured Helicobacter sp.]
MFILRTQTLLKSSIEGRLRERLCEEGLIESIIELPKNIFPHQTYDFSIIVLSPNNESILHINANTPYFYHKDGKYNRLIHLKELLDIYRYKCTGEHSSLTPLSQINPHDLSVSAYVQKPTSSHTNHTTLSALGTSVFRGQRVYGGSKDEKIIYFDLGIADFTDYGFCYEFSTQRFKGDIHKIHKYSLKPYDIAISIRGTMPKFTILSPAMKDAKIVANAGIIIVRSKSPEIAIGIYCYLFSTQGQQMLSKLYERNLGNLNPLDLEQLPIPNDFTLHAQQTFTQIESYAAQLKDIQDKLQALRG